MLPPAGEAGAARRRRPHLPGRRDPGRGGHSPPAAAASPQRSAWPGRAGPGSPQPPPPPRLKAAGQAGWARRLPPPPHRLHRPPPGPAPRRVPTCTARRRRRRHTRRAAPLRPAPPRRAGGHGRAAGEPLGGAGEVGRSPAAGQLAGERGGGGGGPTTPHLVGAGPRRRGWCWKVPDPRRPRCLARGLQPGHVRGAGRAGGGRLAPGAGRRCGVKARPCAFGFPQARVCLPASGLPSHPRPPTPRPVPQGTNASAGACSLRAEEAAQKGSSRAGSSLPPYGDAGDAQPPEGRPTLPAAPAPPDASPATQPMPVLALRNGRCGLVCVPQSSSNAHFFSLTVDLGFQGKQVTRAIPLESLKACPRRACTSVGPFPYSAIFWAKHSGFRKVI